MLEFIALAWLYLVGIYILRRLQDHTRAFTEYGVAGTWALILVWPISAPVGLVLAKLSR
jgi:hypothetical protein